jgi:DnaJ like chaperone protein
MALRGVFFGALLGLLITRTPLGAVLGALIGYLVDQAMSAGGAASSARSGASAADYVRAEFFRATFEIMGHVAKADGRVSEAEIDAARRLMKDFQFGPTDTAAAIDCFRAGKSANFDAFACIQRLREVCAMRLDILRTFMELQLRAALDGNGISPPSRDILRRVAERLGFSVLDFAYMEAAVRARYARAGSSQGESSYGGSSHQERAPPRSASLSECYAVLEIDPNTSDAEVKKAYRRQMSRHHPDKLVARGLPESMAQMAKEKTQRIQEAYEGIRAARGMR